MDVDYAWRHEDALIPHVMPAAQRQLPPQCQANDFWARMDKLMDMKTERFTDALIALNGKVDNVHTSLSRRIEGESKDRKDNQQRVDEALRQITSRLAGLETRELKNNGDNNDNKEVQQRDLKTRGWQPQHIILGGWVGNHP